MPVGNKCSDDFLRQLIQSQSPEAASEAILGCAYPRIRAFVLGNHGTMDDVKDLYQDVFIIVWEKIRVNQLANVEGPVANYVVHIAWYKWLGVLKQRGREVPVADPPTMPPTTTPFELDPDLAPDKEKQAAIIQHCMNALDEKCRSVMHLKYVENKSWDEVAAILHYNLGQTAKSAALRCKEKLRECFKKNGGFEQ